MNDLIISKTENDLWSFRSKFLAPSQAMVSLQICRTWTRVEKGTLHMRFGIWLFLSWDSSCLNGQLEWSIFVSQSSSKGNCPGLCLVSPPATVLSVRPFLRGRIAASDTPLVVNTKVVLLPYFGLGHHYYWFREPYLSLICLSNLWLLQRPSLSL